MASEEVIKEIVPWLDVVMMDIKHIDPEVHKEYTGVNINNAKSLLI
ncbi:MAG: hypothetical protein ACLTS6_06560 [Anaerobutyricum sp.]